MIKYGNSCWKITFEIMSSCLNYKGRKSISHNLMSTNSWIIVNKIMLDSEMHVKALYTLVCGCRKTIVFILKILEENGFLMEEFQKYFTKYFRPEMLKFHPYSILTGDTRVESEAYYVLK